MTPEERAVKVIIALSGFPPDTSQGHEMNALEAITQAIKDAVEEERVAPHIVRAAIAAEREACAKVVENFSENENLKHLMVFIAQAIRSRK